MRIGFVGVGVMGHGMAGRLLAAGYELTVIAHRNRRPVDDLVARGAREAETYAALVAASDAIVLCVSNSDVVEAVVAEMAPALRAGMTIVDMGTSNPDSCERLARMLEDKGVAFVEAPVTGGVTQAAEGALGALVGADPESFARVKPVLAAMCRTVHHFGPPGIGNTAKLLNNFMVFGIAALVVETFERAEAAGIDWQKLYDVVICGAGDSGVLRRIAGAAARGDFKGYVFDIAGARKDIGYFREVAARTGGVSDLDEAVRAVFERAVAAGHGDRLVSELLAPDVRDG